MKKLLILFVALFIGACGRGEDDLRLYEGIPTAEIPGNCIEFREDVCRLFECMVDRCWCGYEIPSPILLEGNSAIQNQEEAIDIVRNYLQKNYVIYDVQRAVQLNTVFYNVFAYDEQYNEVVYTVAADGTIIKTICGV